MMIPQPLVLMVLDTKKMLLMVSDRLDCPCLEIIIVIPILYGPSNHDTFFLSQNRHGFILYTAVSPMQKPSLLQDCG